MKAAFEDCPLDQALAMGRSCTIDTSAWDTGRKMLMTQILRAQVRQHEDLREAVIAHADEYTEDVMRADAYWSITLPEIWKELKKELARKKARRQRESLCSE